MPTCKYAMTSPPRGLFEGKNIMTPDVLAYFNLGDGRWAELTEGRGINRQPIFGVTVRPRPADIADDPSKLCHSKAEAMRFINSLTVPHGHGGKEDFAPREKPLGSGASRAEWLDPTNLNKLKGPR